MNYRRCWIVQNRKSFRYGRRMGKLICKIVLASIQFSCISTPERQSSDSVLQRYPFYKGTCSDYTRHVQYIQLYLGVGLSGTSWTFCDKQV